MAINKRYIKIIYDCNNVISTCDHLIQLKILLFVFHKLKNLINKYYKTTSLRVGSF